MVTSSRILLLVLILASWASKAEDGSTVLIDNSRDIDNTLNPAVNEIKELSESLDAIRNSSEELKKIIEDSAQEEDIVDDPTATTTEPILLIDKKSGVDNTLDAGVTETVKPSESLETIEDETTDNPYLTSEPILLIDKNSGIDNTLSPKTKEMNAVSDSLKDITEDKPAVSLEAQKPEEIDTKPLATNKPVAVKPEQTVAKKPAASLPKIIPETFKTDKQKAAGIQLWTPRDNDLRILEIRVAQYKLEDVISAYQYEDVVLVPIGILSELLDIAIKVEPGFAKGFVHKEEWSLILDTSRAEIILQGKPESYDRALVHELDDDIYVESNLLSKWMLMTLDIDLFSSRIWITSEEKLPFIKRLEREQRIAKTLARLNRGKEQYPKLHEPYKDWSVPFIDQTLAAGMSKNKSGDSDLTYNYTTHVSADLLQHESTWFMNGDDDEAIEDFRVTFARHDNEAELLGFMKASEYAFGNVPEPPLNLITSSGALEPGVAVSNYPLGRQVEYDKHRFRGTLLPGWEVELYQNNALIGYQSSPVDGLYDFPNIPLLFGNNHFRLAFYGPQGQIREEEENYNVNQSLTKKGEHYYIATATNDEDGGSRTTAQYDYGITKNISTALAVVSIPLDEGTSREQHNYTKVGLRGFWDSYLVALDLIDDSASGTAIKLDVQTQVSSVVIGFTDTQFSDFFSEQFLPSAVPLSRRSNLNLSTAIPPGFLPRMPIDFGLRRDAFENGDNLTEITNRLSVNARGYAVTNTLIHQKTTGLDPLLNGAVQVSTNIGRYRVRGSVNYEFQPDTELTNLAATLDAGMYKNYNMSFGITHSLEQDVTEYSASANKATGRYNLSYGARYSSENEINLNVALSVGFGYEPRRNQWISNASAIANQGSVSARVFMDADQDGIFGENDQPLENVGFTLNNGYSAATTAEDGIVFLTGLSPYEPLNVVVSPGTMDDPLWTTALDGVQVTPRPGHAILLEFPIFMSGEVDGTVYLNRNGKEFGVGKVIVELVDDNGQVLQTAETAYDGFYVMSNIPLGKFRMRISNEQLERLSLELKSEDAVELSADAPFVNGVDFVLNRK